MPINTRPARLSVQLDELAEQCHELADNSGAMVDPDRLRQIIATITLHADCARSLEQMLERRLGVRDIPWAAAPHASVVPLKPRYSGNVIRLPVRGGVA